jgi:hypothetical protein
VSNLTIGRAGIDVNIYTVRSVQHDGGKITLSGMTTVGSVTNALALRQQLLGLVDSPDEAYVPVTWDYDPALNGYYYVATVQFAPVSAPKGVYGFSVTLDRFQGYASPLVEIVSSGALRTTSLGLTARRVVCVSSLANGFMDYNAGVFTGGVNLANRGVSPASNLVVYNVPADSIISQYQIDATNYYDCAVSLKVGATGYVAVGRNVPNMPINWTLGNGLFEIGFAASPTNFTLQYRGWNGVTSAWSPYNTITFMQNTIGALGIPTTITVLRNSPEEVRIRLLCVALDASGGGQTMPGYLDITLKRGSYGAAFHWSTPNTTLFRFAVANFLTPTTLTGGFFKPQTAYMDLFIGSPQALTLQTGGYCNNAGAAIKDFPFTIGDSQTTGLSASVQSLLNDYFWGSTQKQMVVAQ